MKDNDGGAVALDRIDLKILERLQANGRMTNQELADAVGLSASPCLSRVRRMERAGVITGYNTQIALSRICRHVDVVAAVTLKAHGPEDFELFENMVIAMRFVTECTKVSGPIDYLVHFVCPDISAYQMLSDELLLMGPKVGNLSSYIVLKTVKPNQGFALDGLLEQPVR
ncbi:winged helix-turn-helix transcriptional regulator [Paracoccus limosus]|jgi:DNA-binding Lrp family transcriptional regulator|uniref:Winged helix-turn-helix transcriptional regulator n=1 Tax=Paracoccus limosus TaxID=913252 RepID=A0A844H666_9RHOB|nr:Lrp/AsnC family transcriptional regulator [Paracoccus limosus]MTH33987.1 winged helix-turn-helix transcriptional regulator [Paracoccus limosus]